LKKVCDVRHKEQKMGRLPGQLQFRRVAGYLHVVPGFDGPSVHIEQSDFDRPILKESIKIRT
jgi:hypothetical protein